MKVFDFARETETMGRRFYTDMAKRTEGTGVDRVFLMLAEDETRILRKLQTLENHLGEIEGDCKFLDTGRNVYSTLMSREDQLNISGDLDAYHLAIDVQVELLSIYQQAIDRETEPGIRSVLRDISSLEQEELNELETLCSFVEAPVHSLEWGEFSNLDSFHNFGRYEG